MVNLQYSGFVVHEGSLCPCIATFPHFNAVARPGQLSSSRRRCVTAGICIVGRWPRAVIKQLTAQQTLLRATYNRLELRAASPPGIPRSNNLGSCVPPCTVACLECVQIICPDYSGRVSPVYAEVIVSVLLFCGDRQAKHEGNLVYARHNEAAHEPLLQPLCYFRVAFTDTMQPACGVKTAKASLLPHVKTKGFADVGVKSTSSSTK